MANPPVIKVIGKAFWDIGHAPKDQSNQRKYMPGYAVWEIHPVMTLTVQVKLSHYTLGSLLRDRCMTEVSPECSSSALSVASPDEPEVLRFSDNYGITVELKS